MSGRERTRIEKAQARLRVRRAIALVLVFCFAMFGGWGLSFSLQGQDLPVDWQGGDAAAGNAASDLPQRMNFLLVGSDRRPGEGGARSDTIMVVSLDRETGRAAVLSIPRDTRVSIPRHGRDKINTAYAIGGIDLTRQVVGGLLDIDIPYYVEMDFKGFQRIIDTLGGVTMNVEHRMYYPEEGIDLRPGLQRLNGRNALGFVRFRYYPLGDIDRAEQQQKFLVALVEETLQVKNLAKVPQLIPELYKNLKTNIPVSQGLELARLAAGFDPSRISTDTLPGDFLDLQGTSYWEVDAKRCKETLDELLTRPLPSSGPKP
ncbi:MAG: LCP family protein [Firmicutes bacterium]|nr:LCP family protein [Bacillota bacterium]